MAGAGPGWIPVVFRRVQCKVPDLPTCKGTESSTSHSSCAHFFFVTETAEAGRRGAATRGKLPRGVFGGSGGATGGEATSTSNITGPTVPGKSGRPAPIYRNTNHRRSSTSLDVESRRIQRGTLTRRSSLPPLVAAKPGASLRLLIEAPFSLPPPDLLPLSFNQLTHNHTHSTFSPSTPTQTHSQWLLSRLASSSPRVSTSSTSPTRPRPLTSRSAVSPSSTTPPRSSRTRRSSSSPSPAPSLPPAPPPTFPATSRRRTSSRPRALTRSSSSPTTTPTSCPAGARPTTSPTTSS
ncbi:hypothetical protein CCHR01_07845 [Colletotrichum chrysophilum]|uniref:Uncharacterized protein n=1 Tax=Colletotrichum chrysophilum TaxID=1836956 RepID=A0AAD9EJB7_9PEZI|nr:hypothetical protein CCHR01_07845 [Colletotrichum chrysophilum]